MKLAIALAYTALGLLGATWAVQAWGQETRGHGRRLFYLVVAVINISLASRVAAVLLVMGVPH